MDRKSFHQETIEDAIRSDPRLLVLYLRPFAAEHRTVFARRDEYGYTFEAYLGHAFRELIGPFVALGSPEDHLPPWGGAAVRTYADDEGWYEYFERLAGRAGCIIMLVSHSDNLQRELTFIRREGLQRRLFIFTAKDPIDYTRGLLSWIMSRLYGPPPAGPHREGPENWEHFAKTLGKLGFELGDDPGRGAIVTFNSAGKAMVLVRGADTPSKFVEPIREYLVQTFGLNLDKVAVKAESPQVVALPSESVVPTPG